MILAYGSAKQIRALKNSEVFKVETTEGPGRGRTGYRAECVNRKFMMGVWWWWRVDERFCFRVVFADQGQPSNKVTKLKNGKKG